MFQPSDDTCEQLGDRMGAAERRKGHVWERAVAAWLRSEGFEAVTSRSVEGGRQSGADLVTDLPVEVECKDHGRLDLAGWVDQAVGQSGGLAAVFVKRRGKPTSGCYVVMEGGQFVELMRRVQ